VNVKLVQGIANIPTGAGRHRDEVDVRYSLSRYTNYLGTPDFDHFPKRSTTTRVITKQHTRNPREKGGHSKVDGGVAPPRSPRLRHRRRRGHTPGCSRKWPSLSGGFYTRDVFLFVQDSHLENSKPDGLRR